MAVVGRMLSASILFLSFLCQSEAASAQTAFAPPPPGVLRQYQRATERAVDQIIGDFLPQLRPEQRALVTSIDIVVPSSGNFDRVFAVNGPDGRRIEIDVGFIVVMELIQDAAILTSVHGIGDAKTFEKYAYLVADLFLENSNAYRRGQPRKAIPPYVQVVSVPPARFQPIYSSPDFQNLRVEYKVQTLAVVLGHELGHHLLGHLDADKLAARRNSGLTEEAKSNESRRREASADAFGVDLAIRAGYNPLEAAWPFIFFAMLGDDPDITTRSHPDSGCRAGRVFKAGAKAAMAKPDFVKELERKGLRAKWEREIEGELERLLKDCKDE